jgi:hypothetical protein
MVAINRTRIAILIVFLFLSGRHTFAQQKEKAYLYFDTALITKDNIEMSIRNYDDKTNKKTYCYRRLDREKSKQASYNVYERNYFNEFDKKKFCFVDSNYLKKLDYLLPDQVFNKAIDFGMEWDEEGDVITVLSHVPTYKKLYIVERKGANHFKIIQVVPVTALIEEFP